jgi:hypothetical protein
MTDWMALAINESAVERPVIGATIACLLALYLFFCDTDTWLK